MKALFLTAGPLEWASSRMRAYWPAAAMEDVAVMPIQQVEVELRQHGTLPQADVYVFQKLYSSRIRAAMPDGAAAVWDVCDPVWWFDPDGCAEALANVNAVTASTAALDDDLAGWLRAGIWPPIAVIDDCIDPAHFPVQATHIDRAPVRFIWYGIAANRPALYAAQAYLERLAADGYGIELTIMDDRPDIQQVFVTPVSFPIYFVRWSLEQENEIIAAHDLALLPAYPGPWGHVKSDNKRATALACGVPTVDGQDYSELKALVTSADERATVARVRAAHMRPRAPRDIAPIWERLFEELRHG